ncbi:MAG: hypothetical protein WA005_08555 [Candidatus Binataceae bacterium]
MTRKTVYRELTAAALLIASYPLNLAAERAGLFSGGRGEPVILLHGFGGRPSNLLGLAAYLRMAGFANLARFEYSTTQSIAESAERLSHLVEAFGDRAGAHLIGHSLGGTIARRFFFGAPNGRVRSLITLGSPYTRSQQSPAEVAIFGDEDPIVPPPDDPVLSGVFKKMLVLENTGHLGVLYHPETLRAIELELSSNSSL